MANAFTNKRHDLSLKSITENVSNADKYIFILQIFTYFYIAYMLTEIKVEVFICYCLK